MGVGEGCWGFGVGGSRVWGGGGRVVGVRGGGGGVGVGGGSGVGPVGFRGGVGGGGLKFWESALFCG